jgi:hypothetical protein
VTGLRVDHREQQQLQIVGAEFAAARKPVAVEAAGTSAKAASAFTETAAAPAAATFVMPSDGVPQRVQPEAAVAVTALAVGVGCELAVVFAAAFMVPLVATFAVRAGCELAAVFAAAFVAPLAAPRVAAFVSVLVASAAEVFAAAIQPAPTARAVFMAGELAAPAVVARVGGDCSLVAAGAITTLELSAARFAAALATVRLMAGEGMPERMERRAVRTGEEIVRTTRTGKTVMMTHLGTPIDVVRCILRYIS